MIWVKCVIVVAVIPLIFTLAFLVFLWGVLRFMYASESKDKEAAKSFIWWGLVGLFVMVSVWGILRILSDTLGLDTTVPLLQTSYLTK
jgi:FtsH-binding integral membrane protein